MSGSPIPPDPNAAPAGQVHHAETTPPGSVPSHIGLAIFTLICCCMPLGIVSLIFASQVDGKLRAGDYAGAVESSDKAKKFAMWGIISYFILVGLIVLFYIVMIVIVAASGAGSSY